MPMLMVEKDQCYLVIGNKIISKLEIAKLDEGLVAFLSLFYLLNFDYPRNQEIGLLMLQHFIFNDKNLPEDAVNSFNATVADYRKFKAE